ncbi:hypothetical protein JHK86_022439 [Glycine max]|nr:hypothetical protein JHK86_022439 [Glycine max]
MLDIDTLQQLQNRIAEMERRHEEELRKLNADHDQLKVRVRHPKGEEHSTTDLDEHLDSFLTQANMYTNDDVILSCVFPTPLKGVALTLYNGFPPRSIDSFNTLIECFSAQYATN